MAARAEISSRIGSTGSSRSVARINAGIIAFAWVARRARRGDNPLSYNCLPSAVTAETATLGGVVVRSPFLYRLKPYAQSRANTIMGPNLLAFPTVSIDGGVRWVLVQKGL